MDTTARVAEIQQFMSFAMGEWPKIKHRHRGSLSQRCTRCIVNESYSRLEHGLCGDCRTEEPVDTSASHSGCEGLDKLFRDYRQKGPNRYDALVLFSGGKDSSYLLYRLSNDYPGLRLLAVMVDNGFASTVALANVERVCRMLDVDHMVLAPKRSIFAKTFRHAFTHLTTGGCYNTVDRMDGDLTFDICRNLTAELNIPLMIAGLSREQVERILGHSSFESPPDRERKPRVESAGFELGALYDSAEIKSYWWQGSRGHSHHVSRVIYPLYAWNLNEQFIAAEVTRLGLIHPGNDNPLITNNDTIPLMLAVDIAFQGYSGFEPEFARMVREGKTDRAVWLNIFQAVEYQVKNGTFLPQCLDDTISRLGLSHEVLGLLAPRARYRKAG